jgi:MFS family permease
MGKHHAQNSPLGKHNVANYLYKSSLLNTVCLVAGISIFFFGYDQGLMGGVNTTRNYAELMGFGHYDPQSGIVVADKPLLQGGIVAVYYLPGTLVGCLLGGWIGDKYGRITTIGLACFWSIIGATFQCSAQNANWMFCARVFNGIGTGVLNATLNAAPTNKAHIGGAATFFVFLYTAIFGATWLTVPWLYPAEIFPLQVRAKGNAWGVVG